MTDDRIAMKCDHGREGDCPKCDDPGRFLPPDIRNPSNNLSMARERIAQLEHAIRTVTAEDRHPEWMRADPDSMRVKTARQAVRYYQADLDALAGMVEDDRPTCPVVEDEARPDFTPERRMWFHLHWSDRQRWREAEAELERLRATT